MEQEGRHLGVLDGQVDGSDLSPRVNLEIEGRWYLLLISKAGPLLSARHPLALRRSMYRIGTCGPPALMI